MFLTSRGVAAFAAACKEHNILEQLRAACDQTEHVVAKAVYAYCLGDLYYTLISSPTVSFPEEELPELIKTSELSAENQAVLEVVQAPYKKLLDQQMRQAADAYHGAAAAAAALAKSDAVLKHQET